MINYYKIKKEWNNGKWDKTQKGAYTNKSEAINNCTAELIEEGYKVFDPNGNIIYPIYYNEVAKILKADGVTSDIEYWSNVFDKKENVNLSYIETIIKRYHDKLNNTNENDYTTVMKFNDINIYKIPISKFKILYLDNLKTQSNESTYANCGYFAGYKESGVYFTLPVANVVCDINLNNISDIAKKYLKERPIINNKLYFAANQNSSNQFRSKSVSTICIKDNIVSCRKLNHYNELKQYDYAISAVPIISNGVNQKMKDITYEGWESGTLRATLHGFLGIKLNDENHLYYFTYENVKSGATGLNMIQEKIKDFGFRYLLKLDGGGSAYFRYKDSEIMRTSENRHINTIITF
ncbi:MAG: hypothetical protein SPJ27_00280 [Candidatus Onthovivens sp.]|nr:hypothetical protein [Candidatus Onthovivens sp.]